ncbi:MAG: Sm-like domain protein [Caudoviricetes sp.]|nr:MAG: Sm-like domain protein [Caudoviricetes sp.]
MLVDNSIKNVIIKFITGEEVICKQISRENSCICIQSPLTFVMAFNPEYPTQGEVSFTPWLVGTDFFTNHTINISSTITITTPSEVVNTKYNNAINTISGGNKNITQDSNKQIV